MSRPTPTELHTGTPPVPAEGEVRRPDRRLRRGWVWLVVLVVVGVAAYFLWPKFKAWQSTEAPAPNDRKREARRRHARPWLRPGRTREISACSIAGWAR